MRRPTYKSIRDAAKKSKRAAIKSSQQKYLYLLGLSSKQVKGLSRRFLQQSGCAICIRYVENGRCPLAPNCYGDCIIEWQEMMAGSDRLCEPLNSHLHKDCYHKFLVNAAKIYIKLMELK